jgi:aerobic carbon-monoxide dehydrogenase medium subunit
MAGFEIVYPTTLAAALQALDPDDPSVRPVGGGTALMLLMKSQLFTPRRLVSLGRLDESLDGCSLSLTGDRLKIGAMTTFSQLEHSPLIERHLPAVKAAMRDLANVRVRNVATVGGNLAHGDPHLDLPPIWAALGAEITLHSAHGSRRVPVEDMFLGYYETVVEDAEIITELEVPLRPGWRTTYSKVTTRAVHDWPAIGLTVSALFEHGSIADIRIFLSAAVDRPTRLEDAEAALRGQVLTDKALAEAGEAAVASVELSDDIRGSATYKEQLLRVHLGRTVTKIAGEQ